MNSSRQLPLFAVISLLLFCLTTCKGQWVVDTDVGESNHSQLVSIANNVSHTDMGVSIIIRGTQPLKLLEKVEFKNVSNLNVTVSEETVVECNERQPGGIGFVNSRNISILGLNMSSCGYLWNQQNIVSLFFNNCQDIKLERVYVNKSQGFALLFWNTRGNVTLKDIIVYKACQSSPNCSGLGIAFIDCPIDNTESHYTLSYSVIHECNNNLKGLLEENSQDLSVTQYGGGLGIVFNDSCRDCLTDIKITNCSIRNNTAYWGGGLFILQWGISGSNSIAVSHTVFSENSALVSGGGVIIGFVLNDSNTSLSRTNYTFYNCSFTQNEAKYGGGTAVFSTHVTPSGNYAPMYFSNCTWKNNTAEFSNDVDLAPSRRVRSPANYLPIVKFVDVQFLSNEISYYLNKRFNSYGSFSTTLFTVHFGGKALFQNLMNTALHMSSSTVVFLPGSQAVFANNSGTNGAALAMYGFSALQLQDNCSLIFTRNNVSLFGGAIYFKTSDKHDFVSNKKCFIQYNGRQSNVSDRNISVTFTDNFAEVAGHSIYALSLYPCYFEWNPSHQLSVVHMINSSLFDNIGNFTFSPVGKAIATSGMNFTGVNNTNQRVIIPGKCFQMNINIKDELENVYKQHFNLVVIDGNITIARDHHNICISGTPNEKAVIQVDTMSFRKSTYYLNITTSRCPPGFYHDERERVCKCGSETTEHAYSGITKCNSSSFRAIINSDYWAGYVNSKLVTAPCPLGFCKIGHNLPSSTSPEELNKLICDDNRMGILCGQCQSNFSIYYHSPEFSCGDSENCSLGIVLYLLSEIFPLLLLFTVIVLFDIQLTFGVANSLTLFAQLLNSVSVNGRGIYIIDLPPSLNVVADIYRVLYGIFNFDFFGIERLSFCLWKGATVLEMLAVKYIAVIVAVLLVLILVMGLHYCQCKRVCIVKRKVGSKTSAIHGLTAILIMSYSQCTKVSFELLTTVTLHGEGKRELLRVTFYGGIEYLKHQHFIYAILAGICLITMITLPPLLLLINPLYLKLFALCGAAEGRLAGMMSKVLMTKKLKPILDSFQGTFKDNFRFFAGLYFLYRISILSANAFTSTALQAHLVMELILILIIGVHATVWPYRKTLHNISDICILVDIALINTLSLYAYMVESFSEGTSQVTTSAISLQASLIFLPLVAIILYFVLQPVTTYVHVHLYLKKSSTDGDTEMNDFIMEREEVEELPYQEFSTSCKMSYSTAT